MKLTSRSHLVKPDRHTLAVAAVTTLVTLWAIELVLVATDRVEARMDDFGTAAARTLAGLAVEPLMRQDRLHLGVIGNRLTETAEIRGVATYSSERELLTTAGDLEGPEYDHAVVIDGTIVGHVRLALHPPAFTESRRGRLPALLLVAVLVPLVVASAWKLALAARNGDLAAALSPRTPEDRNDSTATDLDPVREEALPPPAPAETRHYLLAINLYNQLTLPPIEREFELSLCAELAEAVADVYHGQVVGLPGVGVLLDFDDLDDEDRPFEILCAAFLLNRLLEDEAPFGQYRLGLNLTLRAADEALPLDDDAVADAALLSAIARDGTLAVSEPFARRLSGSERYSSRPLVNPLLDDLRTSSAACQLVTALAPPFAAAVLQRAERLKAHRDDAISSPSTL